MNKFGKKHARHLKNSLGINDNDQLSTLELWQAHLRALRRASENTTHNVEIFDTKEQTSTTIVVNVSDNSPMP